MTSDAMKTRRVLILDDSLDFLQVTITALRLRGHVVDGASDLMSALALAADTRYDVIFSDMQVPINSDELACVFDGAIRMAKFYEDKKERPRIYALSGAVFDYVPASLEGVVSKPVGLQWLLEIVEGRGR